MKEPKQYKIVLELTGFPSWEQQRERECEFPILEFERRPPPAFNINLESQEQNERATRLEKFVNLSGF